jgi:hypothetical protein
MELIDAMPPGLYEIIINEKLTDETSGSGKVPSFELSYRGTWARGYSRAGLQFAGG